MKFAAGQHVYHGEFGESRMIVTRSFEYRGNCASFAYWNRGAWARYVIMHQPFFGPGTRSAHPGPPSMLK